MGLAQRRRDRDSRICASRQEVVARAERYVREDLSSPVPISKLCRIVGRSERGLRDAFYIVHGMSPKRWALAERMAGVRIALSSADRRAGTVTGIASDYGFHELGRFAAAYKNAFGEVPSQTLRSTSRRFDRQRRTREGNGHARR
jgi:AraC-like DNA-binding protein